MIKSELVLRIAERSPHLGNRNAAKVVNAVFDKIKAALVERNRVEVRGFGMFTSLIERLQRWISRYKVALNYAARDRRQPTGEIEWNGKMIGELRRRSSDA
jgi:nucleoid DNA-binding protein